MVEFLALGLIGSFLLAVVMVVLEDYWPRFVKDYWPRFVDEYWPRIFNNWLDILTILGAILGVILGAILVAITYISLLLSVFSFVGIVFIVDTTINIIIFTINTMGKIIIRIFKIIGWIGICILVLLILEYIY